MNESSKKWILIILTLLIVCASLTFLLCKYFYYSGMVTACENSDAYLITGLRCMNKEEYQLITTPPSFNSALWNYKIEGLN